MSECETRTTPYTREELTERGWSRTLLQRNPADGRENHLEIWSPALVARVEAQPGARQSIAANLENRELTDRLRAAGKQQVLEAQDAACTLLTDAVEAALSALDLPEDTAADVALTARFCHQQVLVPVSANQAMDRDKRAKNRPGAEGIRGNFRRAWSQKNLRGGSIRSMRRHKWTIAYLPEFRDLAGEYAADLIRFAVRSVEEMRETDPTVDLSDLLDLPKVREQFPSRRPSLKENYSLYYIEGMIQVKLQDLLSVEPKEEYPDARRMQRRFILHIGGTNTGKTYSALQRLREAETGAYLAPLRLLALEVQERMLAAGVACSMRTGEEEDIVPNETHVSSTVEKADLRAHYAVAVIDECQMIADPFRGFAWTRAILGLQAEEIHLCAAPEALPLLEEILSDLGDPYEVVHHERSVPLKWQDRPVRLGQAKRGDAFIAFSKRGVLKLAAQLRSMDIPTSIIYGAMPYEARRAQMHQFLDGETQVLVATDAIGMGLNLPVRRIVFTETEKFDGQTRRPLEPPEVKQIAGRAGRMGLYDIGFVAAMRDADELGLIPECLERPNQELREASLGFSDLVASIHYPLGDVLKAWSNQPVKAPYKRMDVSRYIRLLGLLEKYVPETKKLSHQTLLLACGIPFDENREELLVQFYRYMRTYCAPDGRELEKPRCLGGQLDDLELYFKKLELYFSCCKTFCFDCDEVWLRQEKARTSERINQLLTNDLTKCGPKCRVCGKPLPVDTAFGVCDRCFRRRQRAPARREEQA
ncbi:MAG: DEAD/DEAH box helicase [Oscillospiraceae bacterium]|nr:DEAD/DEAH box helicase [Oscillospiraceae bacterium]